MTGQIPEPGQALAVAGYAGLAGSLALLKAQSEAFSLRFSPAYMAELSRMEAGLVSRDAEFWRACGACCWEEAGLGGIDGTLWTFSGACGRGVEFVRKDIPVLQGTVEICELLRVNPYRLYSAGCVLLAAADGYGLVRRLAEEGVPARIVGRVTSGTAREVIAGEGRGFLERPHRDEILKILPRFRRQCAACGGEKA